MKFNYPQICSNLLKSLLERQKTVIARRFALDSNKTAAERETLQSIGGSYGITRERVRQIEKDAFTKLRKEAKKYQKVFQYFKDYLKESGNLKREDLLLENLGGNNNKAQIYFLLTLGEGFKRFGETNDFYSFWSINQESLTRAQRTVSFLSGKLKEIGKPVPLKRLTALNSLNQKVLISFLEISKRIQKNSEGLLGLLDWPEIHPRGIKDKAYLVFQKEKKPLHFTQVANFIERALPQTVHNELIKDSRFVLVGRGIYALKEWGYEDGFVKDIISKTLKEAGKPLSKEEILEKVLKQRLVKENTVLLNLSNKKYFSKISEGLYTIREA